MTLRTKTSLLLAAVVTAALLVTGLFYLRFLEQALKNSIFSGLESLSETSSETIAKFLEDTLSDVQVLASSLPMEDIGEQNTSLIEERLRAVTKIYPKFENGMFILDANGILWTDYPVSGARGKSFAFREYFQQTIKEKRGIIGVPYRSARTNEPVLTFTAPLWGPSNEIIGVLGCSVQLLHSNALGGIRHLRFGQSGYIFVYNTSRLMILHPEDERVLKRDVPPNVNKLFDAAIDGFEGVGKTVNSRGIPMLLSLRQIRGTDWIFGAQQPEGEAFSPIRDARNGIIYGIVVAASLAVFIGTLAIRGITAPLLELREAVLNFARSVKEKEDPYLIQEMEPPKAIGGIRQDDEVGELKKVFSDMSTTLDHSLALLRSSAKDWERTFDSVTDAILILGEDFRVVRLNKAAAQILAVIPEQAIGRRCFEMMHGTNKPPAFCPNLETLATGKQSRTNLNDQQSGRILEMTTTPLTDEDGKTVGSVKVMRDVTESKRAEEELRRSRERYRNIFETATVCIWEEDFSEVKSALDDLASKGVTDFRKYLNEHSDLVTNMARLLRIIDVNDSTLKLYGAKDKQEFMGALDKIIIPESMPVFREMLITMAEGKTYFESEGITGTLHGEKLNVFLTFSIPTDSAGFANLLVSLTDITRLKQAEAALRKSEEKYRKLYSNMRDGVASVTLDGRIIECNQALQDMLGYTQEELCQLKYEETTPEKWHSSEKRIIEEQVMKRGYSDIYEKEYIRRDRTTFPVELRSYLTDEGEGAPLGIWAFVRDILGRKRMEWELQRTKEYLENVIENAVDAIGIVNREGVFTIWNKRSEEIFGYAFEEMRGTHFHKLYADKEGLNKLLSILKLEGVVREHEISMLRKNGERVPMELSINLLKDEDGDVVGSVCLARDLREKKFLESQLLHAVKMEAVGTLAGGIAHDFNNLLQAVQGYAELICFEKKQNDPQYAQLQEIIRAARRGGELTKQLLTFSRKVESKLRPINLNQEITQMSKLLERTIPKMISIDLRFQGDLKPVNGDPAQIEQILMNLGVNAKDAMPLGGKLTIETRNIVLDDEYCRLHAEVKPGDYVLFSVADTGQGMEEETLEHIFDPFYTTKEIGRGTGLGLSMVYGIVKNHGGHIYCQSEAGKGTTFTIYLPAIQALVQSTESETMMGLPTGTEMVLLVDDEDFIRDLGQQILTRHGYEVITAPDGETALKIYQDIGKVDLVILDLIMPGMGGSQCLMKLLELDPGAKVVIASGYSADSVAAQIIKAKAKDFIGKPYKASEMLRTVREVLDGRNGPPNVLLTSA